MDRRTGGQAARQTDGQADRWTGGQVDRRPGGQDRGASHRSHCARERECLCVWLCVHVTECVRLQGLGYESACGCAADRGRLQPQREPGYGAGWTLHHRPSFRGCRFSQPSWGAPVPLKARVQLTPRPPSCGSCGRWTRALRPRLSPHPVHASTRSCDSQTGSTPTSSARPPCRAPGRLEQRTITPQPAACARSGSQGGFPACRVLPGFPLGGLRPPLPSGRSSR